MDQVNPYQKAVFLDQITPYQKVIDIELIYTIFYREFTSTYKFNGEKHNFWELFYVDKGEIAVLVDGVVIPLTKNHMIFHKPNEFHALAANGYTAPNAIVISFVTTSKAMEFFENKIFYLSEENKQYLGFFMKEAQMFTKDLGYIFKLMKDYEEPVIGSCQLMYSALESFLLNVYRTNIKKTNISIAYYKKEKADSSMVNSVVQYLEENIEKRLKFDDILKEMFCSKTQLKVKFKKEMGISVMAYFNMLKIEKAKMLIREGKYNFTEIGCMLGYESVHYFSTSFKKTCGMTPTEYETSVKSIAEN